MDDQKTKLKTAKRYRFAENYKMTARTAPDGSVTEFVEYIGVYLTAQHTEDQYKAVRILAAVTAGVSLCTALVLLCVRSFSVYNGGMYVFVPVTVSLLPLLYQILGTLKLPKEDRRLQEDVYRFAHVRIRRSCAGIVVLLLAATILAVVFFLSTRSALQLPDILFFILLLLPTIMNLLLFRKIGTLNYEK